MDSVSATGNVTADDEAGGLIGRADYSPILNSQASGRVASMRQEVGGLVGRHAYGSIVNSQASGDVSTEASDYAGGLTGTF
jgi:hypothetical protein